MLRLSTISLLPKPIRLRVVKWVICNEEFLCYILVFSYSQASFLLKVRGKYSTVSISNIDCIKFNIRKQGNRLIFSK